jgi:hypothetical protein
VGVEEERKQREMEAVPCRALAIRVAEQGFFGCQSRGQRAAGGSVHGDRWHPIPSVAQASFSLPIS